MDEEAEQKMRTLRRAGWTAVEVAREMRVSAKVVHEVTGDEYRAMLDQRRSAVLALRVEGKTRTEISDILDIPYRTVCRILFKCARGPAC